MEERRSDYYSFLLRLWRVSDGNDETEWRASLQDGLTSEPVSFANLEELFVYLRQLACAVPDRNEDERGSGV
jgi:hypothetical protein